METFRWLGELAHRSERPMSDRDREGGLVAARAGSNIGDAAEARIARARSDYCLVCGSRRPILSQAAGRRSLSLRCKRKPRIAQQRRGCRAANRLDRNSLSSPGARRCVLSDHRLARRRGRPDRLLGGRAYAAERGDARTAPLPEIAARAAAGQSRATGLATPGHDIATRTAAEPRRILAGARRQAEGRAELYRDAAGRCQRAGAAAGRRRPRDPDRPRYARPVMTPTAPEGRVLIRSRVSLAGRVASADGEIANGGVLRLTAARDAAGSRHYETRIRTDGFYFFLDLPAGDYVLEGVDQHGTRLEAKPVSIAPPRAST